MTEREFKNKVLPLSSKVYPMAYRLLSTREGALDAVQQGMLKLWENRFELKRCTNIHAFAYTVVRNICLDELKRKKPITVENYDKVIHLGGTHHDNHDASEAFNIVQKLMEQLPKTQYEVIQMRDIDGLDFTEIAEITGQDIAYVRVLLSRARNVIRKQMIKIYAYEASGQRKVD